MTRLAKPTRMQRQAAKTNKQRMHKARVELANRHPDDRGEIMAGEWDQGAGMQGVLRDMAALGR